MFLVIYSKTDTTHTHTHTCWLPRSTCQYQLANTPGSPASAKTTKKGGCVTMATIWRRPGMAAIVMVTVEQASGQCQAMLDYDDTHRGTHMIIYPRVLSLFGCCWIPLQVRNFNFKTKVQKWVADKNKSTHANNLFCKIPVWTSTIFSVWATTQWNKAKVLKVKPEFRFTSFDRPGILFFVLMAGCEHSGMEGKAFMFKCGPMCDCTGIFCWIQWNISCHFYISTPQTHMQILGDLTWKWLWWLKVEMQHFFNEQRPLTF